MRPERFGDVHGHDESEQSRKIIIQSRYIAHKIITCAGAVSTIGILLKFIIMFHYRRANNDNKMRKRGGVELVTRSSHRLYLYRKTTTEKFVYSTRDHYLGHVNCIFMSYGVAHIAHYYRALLVLYR